MQSLSTTYNNKYSVMEIKIECRNSDYETIAYKCLNVNLLSAIYI